MSRIVLGVGASHSTLMNTHWDAVEHVDRAERFRDALREARDAVAAARPDVVVIAGSNHFRGFWLDLVPPFTLGVGEVVASGESGTPSGPQRVDPDWARGLLGAVTDQGFDVALSARLQIDHGQSHAIQYLLDGVDVPVVPLVVNVFAPPLPLMRRCLDLGAAVRRGVETDGQDRRVVVVASGGLSHRLPFPKWYAPEGADEEFLVEAWLEGRGHWQEYDPRRREITRAAQPSIEPGFDREFLDAFVRGDLASYAAMTAEEVEKAAGNGAQELRTWLVAAGAAGGGRGRVLAYEPMPEWLTGMGVALLEPEVAA
ncbi:DODA-type extradiol aromatic ring-opening family dioxygenase [Geodermatophilus sp. SYSU D00696]